MSTEAMLNNNPVRSN